MAKLLQMLIKPLFSIKFRCVCPTVDLLFTFFWITNDFMQVNWKTSSEQPILFKRQAEWSGVKISHLRVLPGEMPEHCLPFHEISVTLAGSLITKKQTATGKYKKNYGTVGNVCLTPAGQSVLASWNGELENLGIDLDASFVRQTALENHFSPNFELTASYGSRDELIQHIGLALLEEAGAETPAGKLYADSLAQTLVFHLLKNYSTAKYASAASLNGGLSGYKLRRVKEFINENLEEDLPLAAIAEVADLSQFHFARAFRRTTGFTPQQYLMQQRIELAKELLIKNDLPIVEISLRAGFKNQSHFNTLFRKYTKFTPKIWRELKLA